MYSYIDISCHSGSCGIAKGNKEEKESCDQVGGEPAVVAALLRADFNR